MPPPRNAPTRLSQRRNSLQDDTPVRTRAGRGGKSAPSKSDRPEIVAPKPSPTKLSPTITRKTTRSASNISGNSFEAAPEIYASYEDPLFMVFGLSHEFFEGLKKHHGKLPKERKVLVSSLSHQSPDSEEASDSEDEQSDESDTEVAVPAQSAPRGGRGRGRGSRGGRGRGRGGRGRGRGGSARGAAARTTSPTRARLARNAAIPEESEGKLSNDLMQHDEDGRPYDTDVSPSPTRSELAYEDQFAKRGYGSDSTAPSQMDEDESFAAMEDVTKAGTPTGTPSLGSHGSPLDGTLKPPPVAESGTGPAKRAFVKLPIPRISLSKGSASQTPHESGSTPVGSATPLLEPEDDILSDADLPEPFVAHAPRPVEANCEDRADYLLQTRFKPMADLQTVIATLTKFPASQRSTDTLFALAQNTQRILKAWQDEYLLLDARVSHHYLE